MNVNKAPADLAVCFFKIKFAHLAGYTLISYAKFTGGWIPFIGIDHYFSDSTFGILYILRHLFRKCFTVAFLDHSQLKKCIPELIS